MIDYLLLPLPPLEIYCLGNVLPHLTSETSFLCPWMCALACHVSKMHVVQMNPPPQEIKASLYQQLVLFPVYLCLCHHPGFIVISSEDTKQH